MTISTLQAFIKGDDGVTMVEYGLLVSLVAMVALFGVKVMGTNLKTLFTTVASYV